MIISITSGHLKLAVFIAWLVGFLPTITWLTAIQFWPSVTYWQVFMPYVLLYGLLVTEEIARGFITKGS